METGEKGCLSSTAMFLLRFPLSELLEQVIQRYTINAGVQKHKRVKTPNEKILFITKFSSHNFSFRFLYKTIVITFLTINITLVHENTSKFPYKTILLSISNNTSEDRS